MADIIGTNCEVATDSSGSRRETHVLEAGASGKPCRSGETGNAVQADAQAEPEFANVHGQITRMHTLLHVVRVQVVPSQL